MGLTTASEQTATFEVVKTTSGIVFCTTCSGTGTYCEPAYHNSATSRKCPTCSGKGKTKIEHKTSVDLREALDELGVKYKK